MNKSEQNNFFWLHIKKAGGESFRKTFTPPYIQTDRVKNYKPFIALPKEEWNDTLNNYRIPLGEYDFKRMLFAKKFLYSDQEFKDLFKIVIVRNPYDRAVSCWKYLYKNSKDPRKLVKKYFFEAFLRDLPRLWENKNNLQLRHLATHTAPIWSDITDEKGFLLVDKIIKLEEIEEEVSLLKNMFNIDIKEYEHINASRKSNEYRKYYNSKTKRIVDKLYQDDIINLNYEF